MAYNVELNNPTTASPLTQMEKVESRRYQSSHGCFACVKRDKVVGGSGDCKRMDNGSKCGFFVFDEKVAE